MAYVIDKRKHFCYNEEKEIAMPTLINVKARPNYQLWLKYNDGVEGVIDLSNDVGKGVFAFWNDIKQFENVTIGTSGELSWNNEVDIDSDAMYLRITGKYPDEIFPLLKKDSINA